MYFRTGLGYSGLFFLVFLFMIFLNFSTILTDVSCGKAQATQESQRSRATELLYNAVELLFLFFSHFPLYFVGIDLSIWYVQLSKSRRT